jgi:hypothetical protein
LYFCGKLKAENRAMTNLSRLTGGPRLNFPLHSLKGEATIEPSVPFTFYGWNLGKGGLHAIAMGAFFREHQMGCRTCTDCHVRSRRREAAESNGAA